MSATPKMARPRRAPKGAWLLHLVSPAFSIYSIDRLQRHLCGVRAGLRRRGQQRLPHPLGQTHPGSSRTFLQQGELRLADLRAD